MRLEHWFYTVPLRLRSLFRRRRVEEELDEELALEPLNGWAIRIRIGFSAEV